MRYFLGIIFFSLAALHAEAPLVDYTDNQAIGVQHAVLPKVNGTTISMMDVKKKMDVMFHQQYPHLAQSNQARFQFYQSSWKPILKEMIDNELILADAADKEVKVTDAEVHEELEKRFGPNVTITLDQIGVTREEAWKLVKADLIVQRMNWWFVHSKAVSAVTPQDIRQAYRQHLQEHPAFVEWKYRVLTIKGEHPSQIADAIYPQMLGQSPEKIAPLIDAWTKQYPGASIALSTEYTAADTALSESHRAALSPLNVGAYSSPVVQKGRDKQEVCRVFYLHEKTDHPAATFEEMAPLLKNQLLQKNSGVIGDAYLNKLRSHYRFNDSHLKEALPDDFQPFSIQ
jgi:hypothetical protein